ncbi:DUF4396 domain-containing protein [Cryobacterium sp. PH31-AA6]|uniref:DUF4396 domain-containing protein n=1 Tax=Cryobacterium sp. PH31-AA6 TaxID=3046205 RepID=UPI0024BBB98D|nr:DUF4396 domain-containing protein [Cryobacterium sp. PH31-AA6]MDJ0325476.1 DUF4396 domain-containing protein [Cryobacterium sp. PH31-AA6]
MDSGLNTHAFGAGDGPVPDDDRVPGHPHRDGNSGRCDVRLACVPGAAASTVAHLVGVPVVFGAGWTIAGLTLWAVALFILVLATVLLFVFELAASSNGQPGKTSGLKIGATALVAIATVILFDIGMVGWMVFLHLNNFMPPPTDIVFTFQMQIGMILGLITAYPLVAWLTRRRTTATTVEPGLGTPELVRP